jgi:dTDP-4-dehydrorhamnose reductase
MVGQAVHRLLDDDPLLSVVGASRRGGDGESLEAAEGAVGLERLWRRHEGFDWVVNCIGLTKAALDERDPASVTLAIAVNTLFPRALVRFAGAVGARVIHLSTDGVFSGRAGPYAEDAGHDCPDVYGKTKSLGEVAAPHVLSLRCSLAGLDPLGHRGLLEWFLGQPDGAEVVGYTDHLWNGVTTLELARLCQAAIGGGRFQALVDEAPVHHVCPHPPVSKYELLRLCNAAFGRRVAVRPAPGPAGPVARVLVSRYRGIGEILPPRPIGEALSELARERAGLTAGRRAP